MRSPARVVDRTQRRPTRSRLEGERLGRESALAPFVVGRGGLVEPRHGRPGLVGGALVGRALQDLDLGDRRGALAVHGAQAVGPGVAAAEDDDVAPRARRSRGRRRSSTARFAASR